MHEDEPNDFAASRNRQLYLVDNGNGDGRLCMIATDFGETSAVGTATDFGVGESRPAGIAAGYTLPAVPPSTSGRPWGASPAMTAA